MSKLCLPLCLSQRSDGIGLIALVSVTIEMCHSNLPPFQSPHFPEGGQE